jgi:exodeoxyribonuclease V gamma subunit
LINLTTDISYKNLYGNLLKFLLEKPSAIFAETWLVVPNHSAKQWLQKSLARDLGVCAQYKFIMPLSFNWEIIKNVASQEHAINIFTKDVLRWRIYDLIINDNKYEFLKQDSHIKNFNLAEKIGLTLLKYNEDHPEIIAKWDGEVYEVSEANQWQVEMWQQLQDNLPTKSPVELLDLFDPGKDFKERPAHIILFATEQLSHLQKATLFKLAQNKNAGQDINIYLTNPCPNDYWFDIKPESVIARNKIFNSNLADIIEVGNPILSSLGYNKMALFDAFLQDDINLIDSDSHYTGNSLLQSVKQDIFNLIEDPSICDADNSINIHACHTRKREIEVIKDAILKCLDADDTLNPEDIIVVSADINDYVDHIKETFNPDDKYSNYIPFHIDRIQLADKPYITALMQLLESFNQEMSANVIYQLLSQDSVLQKFNINENDLPRIKHWIQKSNIRNFYSKFHKSKMGYESKEGNTWQFGKNRWITGYLAGDVDNLEYLSTYGDISGQEHLFSGCFEFLDLWFLTYQKTQSFQNPQQWFTLITEICRDFLYNDLADDFEKKILDQLETKFITQTLESEPEIPLIVVNSIVETVISENNYRSEGQIGVRFQSWENAFIVDAKLLIILGLNDGEFPKKQIKNDLDIFSKTPARLNKSTRQRDKNLMLTALTESTDQLIMTYIGFDAKSNEPQPPAVILAELISYLQQKTSQSFTVIKHKMHGYHQSYFNGEYSSYNPKHFTLAESFYASTNTTIQAEIKLNQETEKHIGLNDLCQFFLDPLQYFLKNNAQLKKQIDEDVLQDTETYNPRGLESWQLKQEIFIHGQSAACKTGIVSDNKSGKTVLNKYSNDLRSLLNLSHDMDLHKHVVTISLSGYKIAGQIDTDAQLSLISIYPSKASAKNICKHWIKHLCYPSKQYSYAYFEDKTLQFEPLENSEDLLQDLLDKWQKSFNKPWLFCPSAFIKILSKSLSIYSKRAYLGKFIETDNSYPSEGQKYFLQQVEQYNEENDLDQFLQPLINSIKSK